jgi:hypothetical protein
MKVRRFKKFYKKWAQMYNSGISTYKIAQKYKCKTNDVSRAIRKMGIELRYKPIKDETKRWETLVIKQEGCWGWKGKCAPRGYAVFSFRQRPMTAHRYSYMIHKGDPAGKCVCHACDNPICSNPDHLFLGTNSDNQQDCRLKNRSKGSKLTTDDVREIRKLLSQGMYGTQIAKKYNVTNSRIYEIKNNNSWWYVT